jgi:hypothetical protein
MQIDMFEFFFFFFKIFSEVSEKKFISKNNKQSLLKNIPKLIRQFLFYASKS